MYAIRSYYVPFDVQVQIIRSMKGFEQAHITRPGYAIEYDFFDPRDLKANMENKCLHNLFFAGQINGTTGYEEAAAQGLLAGINAALRATEQDRITSYNVCYTKLLRWCRAALLQAGGSHRSMRLPA